MSFRRTPKSARLLRLPGLSGLLRLGRWLLRLPGLLRLLWLPCGWRLRLTETRLLRLTETRLLWLTETWLLRLAWSLLRRRLLGLTEAALAWLTGLHGGRGRHAKGLFRIVGHGVSWGWATTFENVDEAAAGAKKRTGSRQRR